ncbi:MAG: hypothetical protein DUD39_05080 [Coriobacteriaceae bacterium]|nr:MAG: hypothetical protein DUD39_05080 [Coriobacteriaceae bacterium]
MLESFSPLQTLPCVSLPAGCTSRLPESLDPSWSLIAVYAAGQMPGWWLLHVLDEHPSLPFPHTGCEKLCGRSPLTRYGALIIVSLERLCSWMMHSAVAEMKSVARTLRKEREGILNWWKRGSTNSFLEGLNSVVQSVRSIARGFRSIAYFRTMILLRLGRLDFTAQKKLAYATH